MQFIDNSPVARYIPASSFRRANLGNMPYDVALIICNKLELADIISLLSVSCYLRYNMSKHIVLAELNIRFARTTLTCEYLSIYSMFHIHWRLRRLSDTPRFVDTIIRVAQDVIECDRGNTPCRFESELAQVATCLPLYSTAARPTLLHFIACGPTYNNESRFPKGLVRLGFNACPAMTCFKNAIAARPKYVELENCPTLGEDGLLRCSPIRSLD